jgi:hypothetical protein
VLLPEAPARVDHATISTVVVLWSRRSRLKCSAICTAMAVTDGDDSSWVRPATATRNQATRNQATQNHPTNHTHDSSAGKATCMPWSCPVTIVAETPRRPGGFRRWLV